MLAPPFMDHQMTGLTGPEGGGAMWDACTALHGPSDDIGVGPHRNQLPNPREAWGQTLQLRQRTQADDPWVEVFPQDTAHAGHTLQRLSLIVHEVVADARAPKRTLSA